MKSFATHQLAFRTSLLALALLTTVWGAPTVLAMPHPLVVPHVETTLDCGSGSLPDSTELRSSLMRSMAPNSEWGIYSNKAAVWVVKDEDLSVMACIPKNKSMGAYLLFKSWSSDNQKFVMASYDDPYSHAFVARLFIFRFDSSQGALSYYSFESPYAIGKRKIGALVDWSLDGNRLAVSLDWREIIVLDAYGHETQRLRPNIPSKSEISSLKWWADDELLYTVWYRVKVK